MLDPVQPLEYKTGLFDNSKHTFCNPVLEKWLQKRDHDVTFSEDVLLWKDEVLSLMNVFEKSNFVLGGHSFIDNVTSEPKFRFQIHRSCKALLAKFH